RFSRDWSPDVCSSDLFRDQLARAHHDAAEGPSLPVDELRGGVYHQVGSEADRLLEIRRREAVVDDEQDVTLGAYSGEHLQVDERSEERRVGKAGRAWR